MNEPLQEFGWKKSDYERPTHGWVCGRLCDGTPCQFGPSGRGACQGDTRCVPEKKGDRYVCTRTPAHGGSCKEGPLPDGSCCQPDSQCQPRWSLRRKRQTVSFVFTLLCLAFCLVIFGGSRPGDTVSPGHVTLQHSSLEHDCASCHKAADGTSNHVTNLRSALEDSQLCLHCHKDLGPDALAPHSMTHGQLADLSRESADTEFTSSPPALLAIANSLSPTEPIEELACSACHREHRGKQHDLTRIADLQCQSCHQKQFHSFSDGHPELVDFPYLRRTRIYFDHARHLKQYFLDEEFKRLIPDGQAPTACASCHTLDATGQEMMTVGFDRMCGSCHEGSIQDGEFPGIAFFALPHRPVAAEGEESDDNSMGEWPLPGINPPLTHIPPFQQLLLADDQDSGADPLDKAWAIKRLFAEIASKGDDAIASRIDSAYPALRQMKPSIVPAFLAAQQNWFPNLHDELQKKAAGELVPQPDGQSPSPEGAVSSPTISSGWYVSHVDQTIRYRPNGHADPLIRAWLNETVQFLSANEAEDVSVRELLELLASPTASGSDRTRGPVAAGRCLSCHTVDRDPQSKTLQINWFAKTPGHRSSRLTEFSHAPHMQRPPREGCIDCHHLVEPKAGDTFRSEFFTRDTDTQRWHPGTDWHSHLTSGFEAVRRADCAACHTKQGAGNSCVKCHNYHAHPVTGRIPQSWREASTLQPSRGDAQE